jgi:nucleotide-binding universal stress UspA family protein
MKGMMKIGTALAEAEKDLNLCLLLVANKGDQPAQESEEEPFALLRRQRKILMKKFIQYAVERNVPMYTKMIAADSMADGIINEIKNDNNVRLLMLMAPEDPHTMKGYKATVKKLIDAHFVNFSVFHDRGIQQLKRILVPVSGGYHIRLAVRFANDIANQEGAVVDYVRIVPPGEDEEKKEDQVAHLQEVVMTELNQIPSNAALRTIEATDIAQSIIDLTHTNSYDLVIIGSSEESQTQGSVFGYKVDTIAAKADCSVLVIYHYEVPAASWLRRQFKPR